MLLVGFVPHVQYNESQDRYSSEIDSAKRSGGCSLQSETGSRNSSFDPLFTACTDECYLISEEKKREWVTQGFLLNRRRTLPARSSKSTMLHLQFSIVHSKRVFVDSPNDIALSIGGDIRLLRSVQIPLVFMTHG